jgi:glycine/D-amino acid oxidase-like deaminating enzyme
MKVAVIGAGVIGALIAYRLARHGAQVTVIDAGTARASDASFGWINASFYLNAAHFELRAQGIDAHHRLQRDLGADAYVWPGCLCWENQGTALEAQFADLTVLGYRPQLLDKHAFCRLEPGIPAPDQALYFENEGAVDLTMLAGVALRRAADLGAQVVRGCAVTAIEHRAGQVTGLHLPGGLLPADRVVVAAGVGAARLLAGVGVALPMLPRPGGVVKTRATSTRVRHILVGPQGQELRQLPGGELLAPLAAAHQQDSTNQFQASPAELADQTVARLADILGQEVTWRDVHLADRPVPGDGLPVLGDCGQGGSGIKGLYAAVMHSGATLGALAAEIAAFEILQESSFSGPFDLSAYRPRRFAPV